MRAIQNGGQVGEFSAATNSFVKIYTLDEIQQEYDQQIRLVNISLGQGMMSLLALFGARLLWTRKRSGIYLVTVGLFGFAILYFMGWNVY